MNMNDTRGKPQRQNETAARSQTSRSVENEKAAPVARSGVAIKRRNEFYRTWRNFLRGAGGMETERRRNMKNVAMPPKPAKANVLGSGVGVGVGVDVIISIC